MGREQTQKNAGKTKLNKRLVRQWLRGLRAMNNITQAERRAWLMGLSVAQARQVFDDLNQLGDRWKESGGDLETLERRRVESKIAGRHLFLKIARKSNGEKS